ncbi:hypothetical protein BS17DRAFT_785966 [Gyrodon lividus]|nr:hypothetical protein BS17DRAFT_785966 [Gyrodon lividus]
MFRIRHSSFILLVVRPSATSYLRLHKRGDTQHAANPSGIFLTVCLFSRDFTRSSTAIRPSNLKVIKPTGNLWHVDHSDNLS